MAYSFGIITLSQYTGLQEDVMVNANANANAANITVWYDYT